MNPITLITQVYTFIGTNDGRVLQYTTNTNKLIARLFSFKIRHASTAHFVKKNAVRAVANFENILAASGYGGEIVVIDLNTRAKTKHILKSKSTVTALLFLNAEKLISANVDGEVHIYNLQTNTSKKLVTTLHEIKQMIYVQASNSLLLSANTNYISLIDLSQEKVLHNNFHSFKGIVAFIELVSPNELVVRLKNSLEKRIKLDLKPSKGKEEPSTLRLNLKGKKQFVKAYEENDFALCYELIDTYTLYSDPLALLLEKHWEKMMISCEKFALEGDAKAILSTLKELLFIETRTQKIGDLLRLSFFMKITQLEDEKLFQSAENIIYSYIDIFGYDLEIAEKIRQYELKAQEKIAIFNNASDRKSRCIWRTYFHQAN